jgi:hypothetical protein
MPMQHAIGEMVFEQRYRIDLKALAERFAQALPYRHRWARHPERHVRAPR